MNKKEIIIMNITVSVKNFKNFILNEYPSEEEIDAYCTLLVKQLECEPEELRERLVDCHSTFYCPIQEIADKYCFDDEDTLLQDAEDISEYTGAKAADIRQYILHNANFADYGFYDNRIIFIPYKQVYDFFEKLQENG